MTVYSVHLSGLQSLTINATNVTSEMQAISHTASANTAKDHLLLNDDAGITRLDAAVADINAASSTQIKSDARSTSSRIPQDKSQSFKSWRRERYAEQGSSCLSRPSFTPSC